MKLFNRHKEGNKQADMMKALSTVICSLTACLALQAQTVRKQVVENGGTGLFKSEVVSDVSCEGFTIYRPQNLKDLVRKNGKMPIILYANGACANDNIEIRYLLSEVASHGYVAAAIGPYNEDDFIEHWRFVMEYMFPKGKDVTLANGEVIKAKSETEIKECIERTMALVQGTAASGQEEDKQNDVFIAFQTYPRQLLEVLDWLTEQDADPLSEYYHCLDLDKVSAMGQSCGGAQVLAVAHDSRIKTCIMLNSGIGDTELQGCSKETLKSLHTSVLYLIGGSMDVCFHNAQLDFERISNDIPVVMINTDDGHCGTYCESGGGTYVVIVRKWLDWQLKGNMVQSTLFLDDEYMKLSFPNWSIVRKIGD